MARRSKRAIVAESLKDPEIKKYVVEIIGEKVAKEVKTMARSMTQSVLKSQNMEHLKSFSWSTLLEELSKFTPVLKQILVSATKTWSNTDAVIRMFSAILLKHRNPNMNLVQKINAMILHAGHSSKQVHVYDLILWLYLYKNICPTTLRFISDYRG